MPETMSVTEVKRRFGAVIQSVEDTGTPVIVTRRGKPVAAIISMDDYREYEELLAKEKEREAS